MSKMIHRIGAVGMFSSQLVIVTVSSFAESLPDTPNAARVAVETQADRDVGVDGSTQAAPHEGAALNQGASEPQKSDISSSELLAIREKVQKALSLYANRHLSAQNHNPWEVMHGMIAYGVHSQLWRGTAGGETVNAIAHVCWNGTCRGMSLLYLDGGRIRARKGPYVQGHHGQLLAILAQAHVKRDYPMRVGNQTFTIADLIDTEKLTCRAGTELTFKLISLAHYLDTDAVWKNELGEDWSVSRLIREEIAQPVLNGVACGGTHRLMGLSYAVYKRQKQGKSIDGEFARARTYISDFHRYNFSLQNPDGSFSTAWFQRRASQQDAGRRLRTTGHILEWLVFSLPEDQFSDPRVTGAVDFLSGLLINGQGRSWEVGPLGHALHGLAIYNRRLSKMIDSAVPLELARRRNAEMEATVRAPDSASPTLTTGAAEGPADAVTAPERPRAIVHHRPPASQSLNGSGSAEAEMEGPLLLFP